MKNFKIELPATCIISDEVEFGENVVIRPNTIISGKCKIGNNVVLGPNTEIINSNIGNNSKVFHSLISNSKIGNNVNVGPFAHLRNNVVIDDDVRIGNYVEIKNSTISKDSKISHLSYIGDSEIGENVNIGAGVITANYDGKNKNKTIVKDNSFIGSNSTLIAPIVVEKNSLVAAGSTLTDDVPSNTLAIARSYQVNKKRKK